MFDEGKIIQFADFYNVGHGSTNYKKWFTASEPYPITYKTGYEPYVLVDRRTVPWYDERFRGYGWDKVCCILSNLVTEFNETKRTLLVRQSAPEQQACLGHSQLNYEYNQHYSPIESPLVWLQTHYVSKYVAFAIGFAVPMLLLRQPTWPTRLHAFLLQVMQIYHMDAMAFHFVSHPEAWVVHRPHPNSAGYNQSFTGEAYSTNHRPTDHMAKMEKIAYGMMDELKVGTYPDVGVTQLAVCREKWAEGGKNVVKSKNVWW